MVVMEPSSPQDQSPRKIIEDVLGDLEPKGSELVIVPPRSTRRWPQAPGQLMKSHKTEASRWRLMLTSRPRWKVEAT